MPSQCDFTLSHGESITIDTLMALSFSHQISQYGGSWVRGNDGIIIVLLDYALFHSGNVCCLFCSELKPEGASPYLMLVRLRKWTGWMKLRQRRTLQILFIPWNAVFSSEVKMTPCQCLCKYNLLYINKIIGRWYSRQFNRCLLERRNLPLKKINLKGWKMNSALHLTN